MYKTSCWLLLIALSVSPLLADDADSKSSNNVIEEIAARVNSSIITNTELEKSKAQLKQEAQEREPANPDKFVSEREKDLLRDMINQQLLLDRGKDLGITADTEVIKKLDEMRKQMNLETMEDLEKAAQSQGVSFEDFKQNLRNQIVTQQVIGKEIGQKMTISKEEIQKYYDEHKEELSQPEQIRLSEILVSTDKKAGSNEDEKQITDAAEAKAKGLKEEIQKGTSFEDVAKKSSDGPTAAQGGDLGYFKRGTLAKELEDLTFAMKPGQVSDPIRTKQGWVLLKVSEHQEAGVPAIADVQEKIQNEIYSDKLQPALTAYLQKLREDAFIEVKPGYVDTGASPNQSGPIVTANKEANSKELKKKKKKLGVI